MTCIDWLANRFGSLVLVGWSMGSAAVVEAPFLRRWGDPLVMGGSQSGWFLMENSSKIGDMEVSPF